MGPPREASARRETPGAPSDSPSRSQGLSRHQRLTQSSLFRETYAQGRRWVGRYMVLWLRQGEGVSLRLGVVASKKVGNAVHRSRAKRRLRECFRRHRYQLEGDVDVVIVARRAILKAPWDEVVSEFLGLASKAGIRPEGK